MHVIARDSAEQAWAAADALIADLMSEYHELGVSEFILSGYPHVEEAYAFGEGVLPVLRERGLVGDPVAA
jgi:alkanesulfonate monooxygenase